MTDEKEIKASSYKKLQLSNEELKKSNDDLHAKLNSYIDQLEKEKAQRSRFELVANINSLNKEFKATDEMDDSFLKGVHHAWSNPLKKAPVKPNENGLTGPPINTSEAVLPNGKPIPDDLKQFMGIRLDLEEHKAEATGDVM